MKQKPFIEFEETNFHDGSARIALRSPDLPAARDGRPYRFDVMCGRTGSTFVSRSRGEGDTSIRWNIYQTLDEALDAGRRWATRKINQRRRQDETLEKFYREIAAKVEG